LALPVLDSLRNGVEAGANRNSPESREDAAANLLTIAITGNGRGMDAAALARAVNLLYTGRTNRYVNAPF
jgi:hypothetical protein